MIKFNMETYKIVDEPFRHVIFENLLTFDLQIISDALSLLNSKRDLMRENENYSKIEIKNAGGQIGELLSFMSGNRLNEFCRTIFNISDLSPDAEFDGGGLTLTDIGRYLRYHFDFPYSNIANKYRVINALLYLSNPEIAGGYLQLLDPESGTVEAQIAPKFGTLAIFPTSRFTPHGFSRVRNHPRISINSYFYSSSPLDDRIEPSKTVWLNQIPGFKH